MAELPPVVLPTPLESTQMARAFVTLFLDGFTAQPPPRVPEFNGWRIDLEPRNVDDIRLVLTTAVNVLGRQQAPIDLNLLFQTSKLDAAFNRLSLERDREPFYQFCTDSDGRETIEYVLNALADGALLRPIAEGGVPPVPPPGADAMPPDPLMMDPIPVGPVGGDPLDNIDPLDPLGAGPHEPFPAGPIVASASVRPNVASIPRDRQVRIDAQSRPRAAGERDDRYRADERRRARARARARTDVMWDPGMVPPDGLMGVSQRVVQRRMVRDGVDMSEAVWRCITDPPPPSYHSHYSSSSSSPPLYRHRSPSTYDSDPFETDSEYSMSPPLRRRRRRRERELY